MRRLARRRRAIRSRVSRLLTVGKGSWSCLRARGRARAFSFAQTPSCFLDQ